MSKPFNTQIPLVTANTVLSLDEASAAMTHVPSDLFARSCVSVDEASIAFSQLSGAFHRNDYAIELDILKRSPFLTWLDKAVIGCMARKAIRKKNEAMQNGAA